MAKDFQDRRHRRHPLYSVWVAGGLFILLIFILRGVWNNFETSRQTQADLGAVQRELVDLEDRRASLAPRAERLRTPVGLDEEIRRNFPVARPGERMVIVEPVAAATSAPTTTPTGASFWVRKMLGF